MAGFCTTCGSGLVEGNSFCTKCGAAIPGTAASAGAPVTSPAPSSPPAYAAAVPPPVYAAPAVSAAAPGASAPQAPVAPNSGSALKIILIVLAVFVGFGILAASFLTFAAWRVSRSVNVSRSGQVTINGPNGSLSVGADQTPVTEAELGVPFYPNAKRQEGSFQLNTSEGSMKSYLFMTSDSPAQVMAFYRDKLSSKTTFFETSDGGIITSEGGANAGFMITVGRDSNGPTTISIVHGISKKAQ